MKAYLIDTHLLLPRSRSSAKVKVKYQGHVTQKMGVSGALVFRKHILFVYGLWYSIQEFLVACIHVFGQVFMAEAVCPFVTIW